MYFFFLFGCFFLFFSVVLSFVFFWRVLWIHGFNVKSANRKFGGGLKPGPKYWFPRFDCLPMWRWSAPGPSQPQLMWGQHQGRPTRVQTNKSRKRVSLVVGGIIETKPNPNPQNPRSRIWNQNSKIQTPKIKTPRSKPQKHKLQDPKSKLQDPKSKLQDPNPQNQNSNPQNQNSKIQTKIKTPRSKPPKPNLQTKPKLTSICGSLPVPPKNWQIFFGKSSAQWAKYQNGNHQKKIWELIFSLKIHETGKMNEKKIARVFPRPIGQKKCEKIDLQAMYFFFLFGSFFCCLICFFVFLFFGGGQIQVATRRV